MMSDPRDNQDNHQGDSESRLKYYIDEDTFYSYLFKICHGFLIVLTTGQKEAVEDAIIEIYLKVWRARSTFREPTPPADDATWEAAFKPWLAEIARNHCRDLVRQRERYPEKFTADLTLPEEGDDPLPARTDHIALYACLGRLNETDLDAYEALIYRYDVDKTWAETAALMGKTVSQVRTLVGRAQSRMRNCLDGSKTS